LKQLPISFGSIVIGMSFFVANIEYSLTRAICPQTSLQVQSAVFLLIILVSLLDFYVTFCDLTMTFTARVLWFSSSKIAKIQDTPHRFALRF